jgi:hypothetical protein
MGEYAHTLSLSSRRHRTKAELWEILTRVWPMLCRCLLIWIGAPDRIRTCDRWLRRPLLYPAELRALENNIDRRAPHAWRVLPHKWGGRGVSNPLPPEPQSGALPGELRPPLTWEDRTGCRIGLEIGRGREIRTPDILLPKQARYQTALYPDALILALLHRMTSGRHHTRAVRKRQRAALIVLLFSAVGASGCRRGCLPARHLMPVIGRAARRHARSRAQFWRRYAPQSNLRSLRQ